MAVDLRRYVRDAEATLRAIDLELLVPQLRGYLQGVQSKAMDLAETSAYAFGDVQSGDLSGLVPPIADPTAFGRLSKQVQTLGPRVLSQRRDGAIDSVQWQSDTVGAVQGSFKEGQIAELARDLCNQSLIQGIAAVMAYRDERSGEARLSQLGGYLRLLYFPDDQSHEWGLYQAWQSAFAPQWQWTVRIFRPLEQRIHEWRELQAPWMLGISPHRTIESAPVPRYLVTQAGSDGQPLGELAQCLPLLKGEIAQQIRLHRSEESTAFPMMVTAGSYDQQQDERGPTQVLQFQETSGRAEYLRPGDLGELRAEHDATMARIRDDMSLPGGFLPSGGNPPSGEALREANLKFTNACKQDADAIMSVLNQGLIDFARLIAAPVELVTISPSRIVRAMELMDRLVVMYEKGLIPLTVAVKELVPMLSATSADELLAWAALQEGQTRAVTPDLVRRILGGGAGAIPPP